MFKLLLLQDPSILFQVFTGERMEAQISYQDVRMLSKKVSSDGGQSCNSIHFDNCVLASLRKRLEKGPGCFTPWIENATKCVLQLFSVVKCYQRA